MDARADGSSDFDLLVQALGDAERVAVLTGAGISSESGIPTFRGAGGLWNNYRAEELATPSAFARDPELVWRWYDWRREICGKALPNPAHKVVAAFENHYTDFLLITQNVDGLHGRAGNRKIAEIHGNIWKARCVSCELVFDIPDFPLPVIPVPCRECGALARPHIVWFGESYQPRLLESVSRFLETVDVLLVIGTSGMVSMPVYLAESAAASGAFVAEINPDPSDIARFSRAVLPGKAGEILPLIAEKLGFLF